MKGASADLQRQRTLLQPLQSWGKHHGNWEDCRLGPTVEKLRTQTRRTAHDQRAVNCAKESHEEKAQWTQALSGKHCQLGERHYGIWRMCIQKSKLMCGFTFQNRIALKSGQCSTLSRISDQGSILGGCLQQAACVGRARSLHLLFHDGLTTGMKLRSRLLKSEATREAEKVRMNLHASLKPMR